MLAFAQVDALGIAGIDECALDSLSQRIGRISLHVALPAAHQSTKQQAPRHLGLMDEPALLSAVDTPAAMSWFCRT